MRRALLPLAAVPALGIARLLPDEGAGLWLRLAAALAVALLPGLLAARALRLPPASGALVWALAATAAGLAAAVALHTGFWLVVAVWAAAGGVALLAAVVRAAPPSARARPARGAVAASGVGLGIALWPVAGGIEGDALFHLARVRKLAELDALSLTAVGEFQDGGLHPGYAFPLWHAFLALVAELAGVDPSAVVLHGASVLAPLALLVAFEAGLLLFGSAWLGGAVAAANLAIIVLAPGSGGAFRVLELPATASRQLLVPAALALVFAAVRESRAALLASVALAAFALAVVHPTYALFLLVPLAGFAVARWLLARRDGLALALALAAFAVPSALVAAALYPVVRTTASYRPSAETEAGSRHGLERYAGQLDVFADGAFRVAPEVLGRTGSVAVAALLLVPLAALAPRRRWAAFVLGGSLAVLALVLVPAAFSRFADVVSLSQARRAAGFLPFAFAFAGGLAVLARLLGPLLLPVALGAGIAFQLLWPGDFGYVLEDGGPAWATWVAALGGAAALVLAAFMRGSDSLLLSRFRAGNGALAGIAAGLFLAPVAAHAATHWDARQPAREPLPEALVEELEPRSVVLSDVETSYRVLARAPVYVVAAPPAHVADTQKNRPYERRRTVARFLRSGDLALARQAKADYVLVDRRHFELELALPVAYRDDRYTLYRLGGSSTAA